MVYGGLVCVVQKILHLLFLTFGYLISIELIINHIVYIYNTTYYLINDNETLLFTNLQSNPCLVIQKLYKLNNDKPCARIGMNMH